MKGRDRLINCIGIILAALGCLLVFFLLKLGWEKIETSRAIKSRGPVNVLVLGDSIWDLVRDETGVAAYLQNNLGGQATVYNLSIKGSQAALCSEGAENTSLCDMVDAISQGTESVSEEIPYEEMDYVILAYGLNDYFAGIGQSNPKDYFDPKTFGGSLCYNILRLREICSRAQFVIVSPTYCQGYSYGKVIHESTTHDFGGGCGLDYVRTARAVAESFQGIFVNQYEEMGISIHNGPKYLIDATHLTEKGRRKYAKNIAKHIIQSY